MTRRLNLGSERSSTSVVYEGKPEQTRSVWHHALETDFDKFICMRRSPDMNS